MASLAALAALPELNQENSFSQVRTMKAAIAELLEKLEGYKKREDEKKKNIVDGNAFKVIGTYSGKESELKDFETRLQALVRGHAGFERFLDMIKEQKAFNDETGSTIMATIQDDLNDEYENLTEKPNALWMNDQLYQVLCLVCAKMQHCSRSEM